MSGFHGDSAAHELVAHFKRGCGLADRAKAAFGIHAGAEDATRQMLYAMWGDLIIHDVVDGYALAGLLRADTLHAALQAHYPPHLCQQVLTDGRIQTRRCSISKTMESKNQCQEI